ncbi:hypothetical protein [Arthrobacter sp. A2-55]|uniref:hypothetical protein n=1 Tax=Arthrobacter sp. A2-55 TaxID=2897337 RepID=UPI0021CDC116|nr:hypothetical protein [Arthrobacter sp. A2-55]MCU6480153.1 hypothetical protein [Arthrobacter sp. A2-55]
MAAILVTAFLVFLAYLMFFVPKMNATAELKQQTATAHDANVKSGQRVAQITASMKNLSALKTQIGQFNAAFPPGTQQKDLLATFTRAAGDAGVALVTLNSEVPVVATAGTPGAGGAATPPPAPGAGAGSQSLAVVGLTINAKGTQSGLQTFVSKIEAMSRPVQVKTVAIQGEGNDANLAITADTYYVAPLVDPEKAAPAAK